MTTGYKDAPKKLGFGSSEPPKRDEFSNTIAIEQYRETIRSVNQSAAKMAKKAAPIDGGDQDLPGSVEEEKEEVFEYDQAHSAKQDQIGVFACLSRVLGLTGEAKPTTTQREINGWYTYEAANAAFFVGTQDFISIFCVAQAESFAKDQWCSTQHATSNWTTANWDACRETFWAKDFEDLGDCVGIIGTHDTNSSCLSNGGEWNAEWIPEAAQVPLFGMKVGYTATYSTATTVSIVLQLLSFICWGSIADYGSLRKTIFFFNNVVAAICLTLMFFGSQVRHYEYNLALFIIAQVNLNFAVILFNAWLPQLAACSPEIEEIRKKRSAASGGSLSQEEFQEENTKLAKITAKLAAQGTAWNFTSAILYLTISVIMLSLLGPVIGEGTVIRILVVLCAAWLVVLMMVAFTRLETRPGPPLPEGQSYVTAGVRQLVSTLRKYKRLPNLFMYLAAYFVYSDGVSSLTGAAAVFGTVELNMSFQEVLIAWFLVSGLAIVSALAFLHLQHKFNISKKKVIIVNLGIVGLLPIYASFALTTKLEFFFMVGIFGLNFGSISTFTRSLFSSIIPAGHESEFFALYQLTDKGTAWAGPLVLSIVSSQTGSFRKAFTCLACFFYVGMILLLRFDTEKAYAEKIVFEHRDSTPEIASFRSASGALPPLKNPKNQTE
ncbi:Autophagy-related protein 22-1 [Durusdinium trenchii]|uniref:Autophagy-related protein 22-1 n=1 Tax=Durusdinium trenchii TaxID=1381693 RepID=A0ABP0SK89_9DINO